MLSLVADRSLAEVPAPDIVLVPGGPGEVAARAGGPALEWLRAAHETSTWTTSVCTGSLILAAAGLLDGKRATSHWLAMDKLAELGAEPVNERVVFDGKIVTGAGVSAGIDMALALAARIAGEQVAQAIQLGIEYDPQPPFDAGAPDKAPAEIVALLRARSRFVTGEDALAAAGVSGASPGRARARPPANLRSPMAEHIYDPHEIESRWQDVWAGEHTWEVSNEHDAGGRSSNSYVLEMLPYPSGEPHIGHLKCYAVGDAIAHYHRRLGRRVLHPMGYDAFGLPAENHAIKTGEHPRVSTAASIASFQRQFRSWGISIDWSRELATCEPSYYRWTQWIFLELFKAGLAYRKEAAVKWCPHDQTVLANEQVDAEGRCERCGTLVEVRQLEQWFLRITDYAERLLNDLRGDRLAAERQDDAAQLDRALGGRGGDVPLRGAGHRLPGVHDAPGHAVRRDVLRDGARAPRHRATGRGNRARARSARVRQRRRSTRPTRSAATPRSRRRAWRSGARSPTRSTASRFRCTWPTTC